MMKHKNSDPIPRTSVNADVSPVNWFVNLSTNLSTDLSVVNLSSVDRIVRSLSLLGVGVGLQLSFSQIATAMSANHLLACTSVESRLAASNRSTAIAIEAQLLNQNSLRQTFNEALNNEDPDLTGQPGTPERTQGTGTR